MYLQPTGVSQNARTRILFFSKNFSRDEVRNAVIPAYMGLIKQIDDQMGRLFQHLEDQGIADQTMIVFTSDHGDYLGDHWLGEKELFHDESVRIPLIIYDPSPEAEATRGTINEVFDGRYKYVHAEHFPPMLFDLQEDPKELRDLGADPAYKDVCVQLHEALFEWARKPRQRSTIAINYCGWHN